MLQWNSFARKSSDMDDLKKPSNLSADAKYSNEFNIAKGRIGT